MSALTNGTHCVKDLVHVLDGSVTAAAAHFRVLVFPLNAADDLPVTRWTAPDELEIELNAPGGGVVKDTVRFARNSAADPFTRISTNPIV